MDGFFLAARLLLAAVFLMSAVPKLATPRRFVDDVLRYRIGPRLFAQGYGWALPYAELVVGISLLLAWPVTWAAGIVLGMLGSFMIAVGIAMVRRQNSTCSCFGLLYRERVGWRTQMRDALLVVLAAALFFNGGAIDPLWELVVRGTPFDYLNLGLSLLVAVLSLSLGLVSVHGWFIGRSAAVVVGHPTHV